MKVFHFHPWVLVARRDVASLLIRIADPRSWEFERAPLVRCPTPRDAAAYILDQFPIVRRNDAEKYSEYRTRRLILELRRRFLA
jgi:hypothetical protein